MDDADNPLTKSYLDLLYDHLSSLFAVHGSRYTNPSALFTSFASFGNASRSLVFTVSIAKWFPRLITWIFTHSNRPGMQQARQNRVEVRAVARRLLDSKRQELKDGVSRKDVMSLLGSLLPSFSLCYVIVENLYPVKTSVSQREDRRLTDEEIMSQVR